MTALGDYLEQHPRLQGLSARERGTILGVSYETIRLAIRGDRVPNDDTVTQIADALGAPTVKLLELAAIDRLGEFMLPREFDLLTLDERRVILAVGYQYLQSSGKADRAHEYAAEYTEKKARRSAYGRPHIG